MKKSHLISYLIFFLIFSSLPFFLVSAEDNGSRGSHDIVGDDSETSDPQEKGFRLVPCGYTNPGTGEVENPCDFDDLIELARRVINLLLYLAVLLAVLIFSIAGFYYIIARGNPEKISRASKLFTSVAVGLAIALGAWVIVHFVLYVFGVKDAFNMFLEQVET